MSDGRVGQGRKVQVDVRVDDEPVTTIVFGAKSGHPFFREGLQGRADTQTQLVGVYTQCLCLAAALYSEEQFLAVLEFVDQLVEESEEREGADPEISADDEKEGDEFPF